MHPTPGTHLVVLGSVWVPRSGQVLLAQHLLHFAPVPSLQMAGEAAALCLKGACSLSPRSAAGIKCLSRGRFLSTSSWATSKT